MDVESVQGGITQFLCAMWRVAHRGPAWVRLKIGRYCPNCRIALARRMGAQWARAATNGAGLAHAEREFVKIAKKISDNRGIGYGAWRDAGVPAVVLRKAGVARTRGMAT